MKFYNPFRPHVVELSNGKFAVRRLGDSGWKYFDNQRHRAEHYWWCDLQFAHNFAVDSLEHAQELCELAITNPLQLRVTRTHV